MGDLTKRIISGIVIGVGVGAIIATLSWKGLLQGWEAETYDWRVAKTAHFAPETSKVVLFYVDQQSLDFMKTNGIGWPWPRALYADVLDFCKRGGARAVIFDLIYSEDSVYGVADDAAFATGLQQSGNGFLSIFLSRKSETPLDAVASIIDKSAIPTSGAGFPLADYPGFMALPIPPLMVAAHGFGNVQLSPDSDGVYRRVPLLFGYRDKVLPSLYISMLHAEHPTDIAELASHQLNFGETHAPLDAQGNLVLKFYGGVDTFPNVGLSHVLTSARDLKDGGTPAIDPAMVKDKVVIVGVSAPGLYDLRPQPLASRYPGAEIHATAFQNILANDYMRVAPLWMGLAGILLLSLLLGIVLRLDLPMPVAMGALAVSLGASVGVPMVLIRAGIWAPMVAPLAAVVGTFAAAMVINFLSEGKKKRMIRSTFQKYLAPDVVKSLLKNPDAIALGGAEQEITIYFSDIAGFTGISEQMSAPELVAALNEYLTRVTQIIIDDQGTVDKYIGDAVMAFWGAPLAMPNHAEAACCAALRIQKMLASHGLQKFATRIGIHTGKCVVGNIGSIQRMNYTVMGDAVNLASRLEGLNKFFGTHIIASGASVAQLREKILCRHLAAVKVKGRDGVVEIFELRAEMANATESDHQFVAQFEKGLAAYRAGRLDEAKSVFELLAQSHNDVTSKRYVQWINAAARAPIGSDWDGVVTFDSK